jgi:hypothetical protein
MNEMPPPKPPDGFQPVKTKRIRKSGSSIADKTENNGYNTDASSVSNYYNPLEDDDDMDSASEVANNQLKRRTPKRNNGSKNEVSKPSKPPPITIIDSNINQIIAEFNVLKLEKEDFEFSMSQAGIKIFTKNKEKYDLIKNHLLQSNKRFYTHALREDQKIKIVLYGLPDMDLGEAKNLLSENNIAPCDIKKMTIKNKKFSGQCHYLLYFTKSRNIRIADVRKVRSLNCCIVKWQYYSKNNAGPTQCSNCQKYGHGANNCFLKPVCLKFSESHKTSECVHNQTTSDSNAKPKIPNK